MIEYHVSEHAVDMLKERGIQESWVNQTLAEPQTKKVMPDGTTHYMRPIKEHGGRFLRVVVNEGPAPGKIITVFFDRRLRK